MVNVSDTIEATRGCIFQCEFCVVPAAWGTRPLQKPVGDVIADLRQMGARRVIFLDLNLIADVAYARELFTALVPLKLRWAGLVTTTIAWDEELLDLAARSGCRGLLIGFESLDQKALDETRKSFNMRKDYRLVVDRIHDRGIAIMGCFVFGFDPDTRETFDRTVDFVMESRMDLPRYAIAVPFPATGLFRRLKAENRILTEDWSLYDGQHVVFEPRNMSPRRAAAPHGTGVEEDLSLHIDCPARARVGYADDDFGRRQSRLSLLREQPRQVLYMRLAARSSGVRSGRNNEAHPRPSVHRPAASDSPTSAPGRWSRCAPATLAGLTPRDRTSRSASTTIAWKPFPSTSRPISWRSASRPTRPSARTRSPANIAAAACRS